MAAGKGEDEGQALGAVWEAVGVEEMRPGRVRCFAPEGSQHRA